MSTIQKQWRPTACVITCYKQPDYVRAVTLAQGLKTSDVFDRVVEVRNRSTGVKRYGEVVWQLIKTRLRDNPDVYVVTFRGYEILPIVLLISLGKKVIYDEMINPVEWFVHEHRKFGEKSLLAHLLKWTFYFLGKRAVAILTDTPSHADYSAALMGLSREKYATIPVSADEAMFFPTKRESNDVFTVLYCGNMKPLYGVEYVLEAAIALKDRSDIVFHIVGGKKDIAAAVQRAVARGARITYEAWVPYKDFPALFHASDLCLGGPFGGTVQSQFIVTGKTYQFLAAGLPVVVGDNKEVHIFKNRHNALVVPEKDVMALKNTVEWASVHPKELAQLAKNGRKLYEKEFSSLRVANDLRSLFAKQGLLDMKTRRYAKQSQQKQHIEGAVEYARRDY